MASKSFSSGANWWQYGQSDRKKKNSACVCESCATVLVRAPRLLAVEHFQRLGVDRTAGDRGIKFRGRPDHTLRHVGEGRRLLDDEVLNVEIVTDVLLRRVDDGDVAQILNALLQRLELDELARLLGSGRSADGGDGLRFRLRAFVSLG